MFPQRFTMPILALPRSAKRFIVLIFDTIFCVLSVWLAFYLRLGEFSALSGNDLFPVIISIGLALPIFIASGLYRAIFRYSGWPALMAVAKAISIYGLIYVFVFTVVGVQGIPRTIGLIQPILLLLFVGGFRVLVRIWFGDKYQSIIQYASRPKVLVYGAGSSGRQLVAALANSHEMQVVGFLDDDSRLHGHVLNGQTIFNPADLVNLSTTLNIRDVLLAMPSISRNRRNEILTQIRRAHVAVRTLPSVTDLAKGKVSISDIRELDIDDLLGREPVLPNYILLTMNISGKVVMVTGAGGSIGSELCRQIISAVPSKLLLIEQSEFALYTIQQQLEEMLVGRGVQVVPLLASVQDPERMNEVMTTWQPDTIYHTAAYKHVPLVEHNPAEGIKNNVFGTLNIAQLALETNVSNFVLISTDKAVRPTNFMGASKRLAEMVLQGLAIKSSTTKFCIVRFGNVLGSSGSVVPKFREQIRAGGPITITHPEITRYFMTIPEASQLVIQAGAMAKGGEIFVLNMGEAIKIIDLAYRMVELSGLTVRSDSNPNGDIEIEITGLRPAEKLYEELLIGNSPEATSHPRIMKAYEEFIPWEELEDKLNALDIALGINEFDTIRSMMKKLINEYTPSEEIVDLVFIEQQLKARN